MTQTAERKTPLLVRAALGGFSAAVAGSAVWIFLSSRPEPQTVHEADNVKEVVELLESTSGGESSTEELLDVGAFELEIKPLDRPTARKFMWPIGVKGYRWDETIYYRRVANWDQRVEFAEHPDGYWPLRTNNMGLRNDADTPRRASGTRVLLNGDSHTDGSVGNPESFTTLLAGKLRELTGDETIETLNTGVGGYHFYNYLGGPKLFLPLQLDAYVLVVFGGNDFAGPMRMQRYFHGRGAPKWPSLSREELLAAATPLWDGNWGPITNQELSQALYFLDNPEDVSWATGLAIAVIEEIDRQCREADVPFLCVYLPPPLRSQSRHYPTETEAIRGLLAKLELPPDALDVSHRIADTVPAHLARAGVETFDLREPLAQADEGYFWSSDMHLSVLGNQKMTELLAPRIAAMLE